MTIAITGSLPQPNALVRPAASEAPTTTKPAPAATAPATAETSPATIAAPESPTRGKASRAHVQQSLHHLTRVIRHAVKDATREAGMDPEQVAGYRDLLHGFRDSLQDTFHAAGSGRDFDHSVVLAGVGEAMTSLTAGLKALRGADDDVEPVETLPVENPPVAPDPVGPRPDEPTTPLPDLRIAPEPGGLLSAVA
ncbi:MAG: hypothetical protein R6X25_15185 [Candidatus Krumholzibacteriia bacterium]